VQARRRVEAISWALNLAPVPVDRGGQPSSACKFVLVGLANHAGPDGTGAFPSVATLVRYTGLSERTVRMCLDRLEAAGIVSPCDPGIVAVRIKRADRRPQGWDLNLSLVRDDLDDAAIAILEHQFPGLGIRLAAAAPQGADGQSDGVQSPHPDTGTSEAVDNRPDGVQQVHPEPGTGCYHRSGGVQPAQERGAAVAPEPSREPSTEPSAASAQARFTERIFVASVGGTTGCRGSLSRECAGDQAGCPGHAGYLVCRSLIDRWQVPVAGTEPQSRFV
jgi:Helix-turn-helix domain